MYRLPSGLLGSSSGRRSEMSGRVFQVEVGEIIEEELKAEKPLLMAIKRQIHDVSQSSHSDNTLMRVLRVAMNLSMGSTVTLIFHFNLYITDDQLTYTAERCPKLKRLVMPSWNRVKKSGICKAIRMWPDLESMTLLSMADLPYLLEEISRNCKNFSELKVIGPCDTLYASALTKFLPGLKVLSLRCSRISKEALNTILEGLPNLEVLNISHSLIIDVPQLPASPRVLKDLDQSILKKAGRLRRFFTCTDDNCTMCQRTRADDGLLRWYRYEELWKMDEVKSLAL
ncbi:F-box/LRR-repeat protein At3g48880 isoform X2 [Diospyros lotus]|uniref:F-box/LRR-repeat protein At3g48880 isoform X2 n=1 Tax=Diospyros lotus TaxID=55363 RepID=UPI0022571394|nr:F-box/LRR-repeat protein At3g48880 isoform X2 [Diospyros lotus]